MIVKLATMARNGEYIPTGNYGNVIVVNKNTLTEQQFEKLLTKADQVLCGTNRMRKELNRKVKIYLGLDPTKINIGEKVICLLNNWEVYLDDMEEYSLVNGITGYVRKNKIEDETLNLSKLDFQADFLTDICENLIYDNSVFQTDEFKYQFHQQVYVMDDGSYQVKEPFIGRQSGESKSEFQKRIRDYALQRRDAITAEQINFFEPAYCISVHKSQGSEYNNVVLFDESKIFGKDANRWLYTRY